jgi:hypothetical protein
MGDVIAAAFGPIAVNPTGIVIWSYIHPPKGKASRVGLITVHIASGTQTGKICIRYGPANIGTAPEIHKDVFTANDPSVCINPNFVIQPGQAIYLWMWDLVTGDTILGFIEGH